jgi:dolichol-phosphate mannosyltransferase
MPEPGGAGATASGYELTVVVPTFNEHDNVAPVVERLRAVLDGIAWQAIFVDDHSADGTAEAVKAIARTDPRIQCLHRVGRRGLAGAVIEGAMASAAPFVAVIDGDLQHDESLLPQMLDLLREGQAELVIGSRYLDLEETVEGLSPIRRKVSLAARGMAAAVLHTPVTDPVSGFFMIRRERVLAVAPRLSVEGFKILFDLIICQPGPMLIVELPYRFKARTGGASKFDMRAAIDYAALVGSRMSGNVVSPQMLLFFVAGATGIAVHLAVLGVVFGFGVGFPWAQTVAGLTAMTSNYLVNNAITYRDRQRRGWALLRGFARTSVLSAPGLITSVAVGGVVYRHLHIWWLAGIAGAGFGAVWNSVVAAIIS